MYRWCAGLLLVASCAVSAGSVESDVDAPIRVTVYDYSNPTPLANAQVQFVAPDGTTQSVMTDSQGVAEAVSPAGTTVVVHQTAEGPPFIKAFYDAAPGDAISAGVSRPQSFSLLPDVTFQLHKVKAASSYVVEISCAGNNGYDGVIHVAHISDCPQAHDALAVAYPVDVSGAAIGGASVLMHLDLAALAGTTVKMPAFKSGNTTITAQISNLPAGSGPTWSTANYFGNDPTPVAWVSVPAANGLDATTFVDVGDRTTSSMLYTPAGSGYRTTRFDSVSSTRVGNFVFDASQSIRAGQDAAFDAATQTLSWIESSDGREGTIANFTLIATSYSGKYVRIDVHAPAGDGAVTLPALPPELTPASTDQIYLSGFAQLVEGSSYRQYMPIVDTNPGYSPVGRDPLFRGSIWTATYR